MKKQITCKNIFPNISSFFTVKNLVKLLTTLIITFYLRSYIVTLFDLGYSCLKDLFLFSILQKEVKNCLVFVDNNLCDKCEPLIFLKGIELNHTFVINSLKSLIPTTLAHIYYNMFKLNYKESIEGIVSLMKYDIEFKYFDVIKIYLNSFLQLILI